MDLNIYDVIVGPWVTTKAYALNQNLRQLVLEVNPKANKSMICEALKKLFNVDVDDISVVVVKGKMRRAGRSFVQGKSRKKAIVSLKDGHSVDLAQWTPTAQAAS